MDHFIELKEQISEDLLSSEHYFESLLRVLHSKGLLYSRDIESIQLQIIDIFTETAGYYTRNESSSVRVEIAEQILLSVYYTIGLFLKSQPTLNESIALIKKKDMRSLFAQGEKILKAKVIECQVLYNLVMETRLDTGNYAYIDTLEHGIPLFFRDYDPRFASHDAPASIDYPLGLDEGQLVGVEYIEDYLNKVILENKFCSYFDSTEIRDLSKGFHKNFDHMLINIFVLVLTNCLGRILAGKGGRSLEITKVDRIFIKGILENLPQRELEEVIFMAAQKLCEELEIQDNKLTEYINGTVCSIIPEIKRNLETDTLENIFITLVRAEKETVRYNDGKGLDNSSFRTITEEIRDCCRVEDKIGIIRRKVHSLEDLIDVLSADCIFGDEFIEVFKALDIVEIALLIKSISNEEVWDTDYGTESEKEWHKSLEIYLESLDGTKKTEIISISQGIEL
ncbi:MAG: DUF6179 domain-containing protein [Bacillota bacterium]|nr:DUF6179 domain-containing protein [Bacillota bacterium]